MSNFSLNFPSCDFISEGSVFPEHDFPVGCVIPIPKEPRVKEGSPEMPRQLMACPRSQTSSTWREFYPFKRKVRQKIVHLLLQVKSPHHCPPLQSKNGSNCPENGISIEEDTAPRQKEGKTSVIQVFTYESLSNQWHTPVHEMMSAAVRSRGRH